MTGLSVRFDTASNASKMSGYIVPSSTLKYITRVSQAVQMPSSSHAAWGQGAPQMLHDLLSRSMSWEVCSTMVTVVSSR